MKEFFAGMNLSRAVILLALLGSAVLGWLVQEKSARLAEIDDELQTVPVLAKEIQRLGIELQQYVDISGPNAGADTNYHDYVRSIASSSRVEIGQVNLDPDVREYNRDVEDRNYKVTPQNKNQRFHQSKIGNFLYTLEAENRRVKVTRFEIRAADTIRPGEVGTDSWTFSATITERRQKTSS